MSGVIMCTASYDRTIKLWEATTGACYHTIQFSDSQLNCIKLTNNKKLICAGGNRYVRIYKIKPGQTPLANSFEGHKKNILTLSINDDDTWLISGSEDKTIKVWDFRMNNPIKDYKLRASVNSIALHPNQVEFVSGDEDGNLQVWDLSKNACRQVLRPRKKIPIRSVSINAKEDRLVCAMNDGTFHVYEYDSERKDPLKLLKVIHAHPKRYILKCLYSPNSNSLATCSADGTVKIFNAMEDKFDEVCTLKGHKGWVWDIEFSSCSGYVVSCSSDELALLWDIKKRENIKVYKGHQKTITCVALNDKQR